MHTLPIYSRTLRNRYIDGTVPKVDEESDEDQRKGEDEETIPVKEHTKEKERDKNSSPVCRIQPKFKKLTAALCEVVNDFGLVSFLPLNIQDKQARRLAEPNPISVISCTSHSLPRSLILSLRRRWHASWRKWTMPMDSGWHFFSLSPSLSNENWVDGG